MKILIFFGIDNKLGYVIPNLSKTYIVINKFLRVHYQRPLQKLSSWSMNSFGFAIDNLSKNFLCDCQNKQSNRVMNFGNK